MIRWMVHVGLVMTLAGSAQAKEWDVRKGDNFIIHYRKVPESFVNTVLEEAESSLDAVADHLGATRYQNWKGDERASIYIYENQEDYVQNGGQAGWSHGAALTRYRAIRTYPSASGFFDSLLPHELAHIVLHEFVGIYTQVPLWFDEGVAMYMEKAQQYGAHGAVRTAIENGQFIPLTDLMNMRLYKNTTPDVVKLFYMESASIVNFMITELGESRFRALVRELKDQRRFEDALAKVYINIRSLDDLNRKWKQFLDQQ